MGSTPAEISEAEDLLKEKAPTSKLIDQAAEMATKAVYPVANALGASPSYRRRMIGLLTRRALVAVSNTLGIILAQLVIKILI